MGQIHLDNFEAISSSIMCLNATSIVQRKIRLLLCVLDLEHEQQMNIRVQLEYNKNVYDRTDHKGHNRLIYHFRQNILKRCLSASITGASKFL